MVMVSGHLCCVAFLSVWLIGTDFIKCADTNGSEESEDYVKLEDLVRQEIRAYFRLLLQDNGNELNSLFPIKDSNGRDSLSSQQIRDVVPQSSGSRLRSLLSGPSQDDLYDARETTANKLAMLLPRRGTNNGRQLVPTMSDYDLYNERPSYRLQSPDSRIQYINGYGQRTSDPSDIESTRYRYSAEPLGASSAGRFGPTRYEYDNEPNAINFGRIPADRYGPSRYEYSSEPNAINFGRSASGFGPTRYEYSDEPSAINLGGIPTGRLGPTRYEYNGEPSTFNFVGNPDDGFTRRKNMQIQDGYSPLLLPSSESFRQGSAGPVQATTKLQGLDDIELPVRANRMDRSQNQVPYPLPPSESISLLNDGSMRGKPIKIRNFEGFLDGEPVIRGNVGSPSQNQNQRSPPSKTVSIMNDGSTQGLPLKNFLKGSGSPVQVNSKIVDQNEGPADSVKIITKDSTQAAPSADLKLNNSESSPEMKTRNLDSSPADSLTTVKKGWSQGLPLGAFFSKNSDTPVNVVTRNIDQNPGSQGYPKEFLTNVQPSEQVESLGNGGLMRGQRIMWLNSDESLDGMEYSPAYMNSLMKGGSIQGHPIMMSNIEDFSGDVNPSASIQGPPTMISNSKRFSNDIDFADATNGKGMFQTSIPQLQSNSLMKQPSSETVMEIPKGHGGQMSVKSLMDDAPQTRIQSSASTLDSSENGLESSTKMNAGSSRWGNIFPRNYQFYQYPIKTNTLSQNYMNDATNPEAHYITSELEMPKTTEHEVPVAKSDATLETNSNVKSEANSGAIEEVTGASSGDNSKVNRLRKYKVLVMNGNTELPSILRIPGTKIQSSGLTNPMTSGKA